MTNKEFLKCVTGKKDLLFEFVSLLKKKKIPFCVIGGLAVNAYAEPVVSLDFDVVVVVDCIDDLLFQLKKRYKIKHFSNSINISCAESDLIIQIQTDTRYQDFIRRAKNKDVLGYKLPVAAIEDVLQGKIWAALDETRRGSKRQKDLADIVRLMEREKELVSLVPDKLKKMML